MKFVFSQDGDSNQGEPQFLAIKLEDAGGGLFYVIETKRWSFEQPEDLLGMIEQVKKLCQAAIAESEKRAAAPPDAGASD